MSSTATKPEDPAKSTEPPKKDETVPHLGVLEEDDEFEEFAVQGELLCGVPCALKMSPC